MKYAWFLARMFLGAIAAGVGGLVSRVPVQHLHITNIGYLVLMLAFVVMVDAVRDQAKP